MCMCMHYCGVARRKKKKKQTIKKKVKPCKPWGESFRSEGEQLLAAWCRARRTIAGCETMLPLPLHPFIMLSFSHIILLRF